MLALLFIPPVEGKTYVNHINHNPLDNHIENLEWVTPIENIRKSHVDNGSSNPVCKLTWEQACKIREQFGAGISCKQLAKAYLMNWYQIRSIIRNQSWHDPTYVRVGEERNKHVLKSEATQLKIFS